VATWAGAGLDRAAAEKPFGCDLEPSLGPSFNKSLSKNHQSIIATLMS
jgi:hypothetical protein